MNKRVKMLSAWVESLRLRTLPVSISGVVCACAFAVLTENYNKLPGILCFAFAVMAQISSNFANEYYDYKSGVDKTGRTGPRRGVTEGDISPCAMKTATFVTLAIACAIGCSLIYWGDLWLIVVGVIIALGVLAYSAGPYPLSHHGMGEIAVVFFFGIIPVNMTYYLMTGYFDLEVLYASLAIGMMGANVLIVNNYRDYEEDKSVGKNTLCVIFGKRAMTGLYVFNGIFAILLMIRTWLSFNTGWLLVPATYLIIHSLLSLSLQKNSGAKLTPLLGMTAMLMLCYNLFLLLASIFN